MSFAIREINQNTSFLQNVSLGMLTTDTCKDMAKTIYGALWILSGKEEPVPGYHCQKTPMPPVIIGAYESMGSAAIAGILGLFGHPQVSYSTSNSQFSDKKQFPSFLRTIPSNDYQAQLLHYLKNVRFKNKLGEEMYFDQNGDPPATYDIINWQLKEDGNIHYVKVGKFDSSLPTEQKLYFSAKAIQWNLERTEVPRSVCSESCPPGFRKAAQKGRPICCFDCVPCAEGEVSNETDSSACWQCPDELWPNEGRSKCVPKIIEYLSYEDSLGAILAGLASLSSTLTAAILCVFIKYRGTPIVKANNRELTYFLLVGLVLGFLSSLLFIGVPRTIICLLRQPAFGIIFVFSVSCVLAKTIMVVIAFRATKPDSNMRRWLGPKVPIATVSLCTLGQVLICVSWILLCPPFPQKNMKLKIGTIILLCNECSEIAFWCMLGYIGLLACVSFLVAFLARTLPDSFNEAKWITFSMFLFLSVWMYFILGYLSNQGKYMVAVEIFAIICSSAGLLFCIFFPKCYIILIRPDLNTREQLLGKRTTGNKMKSS
ncbi:vomeronasal type-2 receptor 26-like [Lissotriton helveticus]